MNWKGIRCPIAQDQRSAESQRFVRRRSMRRHAVHKNNVACFSIQTHGSGLVNLRCDATLKVTIMIMVQTRAKMTSRNHLKTAVGAASIIQIKQNGYGI